MCMTVERITLDTNILIYAFDATAKKRHEMAVKVLERAITCDCLLTLQALSEFFNVLTRKNNVPSKTASQHVNALMEIFPVVTAKQSCLTQAMKAVSDHSLSFWDAMLWSTAADAGVTILLSEDFQHQQLIKKVRIINPFVSNEYWHI